MLARQAGHHAGAIGLRLVLVQLPAPLQAIDRQPQPNNRARHPLYVLLRRVRHRPGLLARLLVLAGEPRHMGQQFVLGVESAEDAMGVHHHIGPGRHHPAMLLLALVPTGMDVGLRPLKDRD